MPCCPHFLQPGLTLEDGDSASANSVDARIEQERNAPQRRRVLKKMQSDVTDAKMSMFYARQVHEVPVAFAYFTPNASFLLLCSFIMVDTVVCDTLHSTK